MGHVTVSRRQLGIEVQRETGQAAPEPLQDALAGSAVGGGQAVEREGFLHATTAMIKHKKRSLHLSNLVNGPLAAFFLLCIVAVAVGVCVVLYGHDVVGDAAQYSRVPATVDPLSITVKGITRGSGKNKRTVYILRAVVVPDDPEAPGGAGSNPHFYPLDEGVAEEADTSASSNVDFQANSKGEMDASRYGREGPGNFCPWYVPGPLCRMWEDATRADAWSGDESGGVPLTMEFSDHGAAEVAAEKVRGNDFVLRDGDSGELFLLTELPIGAYFFITLPLAIASVLLVCTADTDKLRLYGRSKRLELLPAPTRVWMPVWKRYLWQLHPVTTQLLPKEITGTVSQQLAGFAVLLSLAANADLWVRSGRCAASAECAMPVEGFQFILWFMVLAEMAAPCFAFWKGSQHALVGNCVERAQVGLETHYTLPPAQNVAWPRGSTRTVFLHQDTRPNAPAAKSADGGGGGRKYLTVTSASLELRRYREFKRRGNNNRNTDVTALEFTHNIPLPDLTNASVTAGTPITAAVAVTVPEDAILSSVPGQDRPFHSWYLAYTVSIAGMGTDTLMVPMHVVRELELPGAAVGGEDVE